MLHFSSVRALKVKSLMEVCVDQVVGQLDLIQYCGNVNRVIFLENNLVIAIKFWKKNAYNLWPSNSSSRYYHIDIGTNVTQDKWTRMPFAVLFLITKSWKHLKGSSWNWWNKRCYIYLMKHYVVENNIERLCLLTARYTEY